MFRIVWFIGIVIVMLILGSILFYQIFDDLTTAQSEVKKPNRRLLSQKGSREATIFEALGPYLSVLSLVFSLLLFGLFHELFLKEFHDFLENIKVVNYGTAIPFFLAVAASGALICKAFIQKVTVENRHVRIARAKSVVITSMSFILYLLAYSFFHQLSDPKFNLAKGFAISFTLGVLFYLIFGEVLKIPWKKWLKSE